MTAAQILRDALTQYAAQTLGTDRATADRLATQADEMAEAIGEGPAFLAAVRTEDARRYADRSYIG